MLVKLTSTNEPEYKFSHLTQVAVLKVPCASINFSDFMPANASKLSIF